MTTRRYIGPVTTLAVVGVVGTGLWLANVAQNPASPTPAAEASSAPAAVASPVPAVAASPAPAAPAGPAGPAAQEFPAKAEYVGKIPLPGRVLSVEISVDGQNAKAYACDNAGIESWLSGPAVDGALRLTDTTGADRLNGQLRNGSVVGTLWIGERSWEFEAPRVVGDYAN
ncbi:hypothetical protein [Mycolicibacterium sp.]|uniref:hypothetical protein n=1 Tax=Mycolicibacterium sp. TaxID=2320850 RepID=UPI003D0C4932